MNYFVFNFIDRQWANDKDVFINGGLFQWSQCS